VKEFTYFQRESGQAVEQEIPWRM